MRKLLSVLVLSLMALSLHAQDLEDACAHIDTLASESMHGRGYVNNGDELAANYLVDELKEMGVMPWNDSYRQKYSFAINTFPGKMMMKAGDKVLRPGYDFQVKVWSEGVKGKYKVFKLERKHLKVMEEMRGLRKKDMKNHIILVDPEVFSEEMRKNLNEITYVNFFGAAGYITLNDTEKLTWSVAGSGTTVKHIVLDVRREAWNDAEQLSLDIESRFFRNYKTANVMGYLPGTEQPDSFVLVTAHYDHLGRMGENTCYCGAHDNASGTAMTLDLARYFSISQNRPKHSLLFVFFSGEEAGLHGSRYFADNPPLQLEKIKFVMNIDLIGSGSKGIKVVNGSELKSQFELLNKINEENNYIAAVKKRGEAANSDHYPLYAKGVPAFFVYTLGDEYKEYHNPDDRAEGLPLTAYEGLFRLIRDYVQQI